ncbi:MAG: transposase [Candidatus Cloacimonetes bacterium]|nr:transposase [Candidatus Cloacimonadota bacterium]
MRRAKRIFDFGELEGDRRSTGDSPKSKRNFQRDIPDTEVSMKKRRRRFSKEFKLRILKELDESTKPGQIGAVLRREGIYYSNITKWREQLEQGKLNKKLNDKNQKNIAELSKQNRKLQRELNQAKLIIEAQKKFQRY